MMENSSGDEINNYGQDNKKTEGKLLMKLSWRKTIK